MNYGFSYTIVSNTQKKCSKRKQRQTNDAIGTSTNQPTIRCKSHNIGGKICYNEGVKGRKNQIKISNEKYSCTIASVEISDGISVLWCTQSCNNPEEMPKRKRNKIERLKEKKINNKNYG